nr:replication protein A 70 kDa DNA-binding subunit B [Tanacetum cinerariifolium]
MGTEVRVGSGLAIKDYWARSYKGITTKFAKLHNEKDSMGHVVMILQLAKDKQFNEKPCVSNAMYFIKFYINDDISEIDAFKQSWTVHLKEMEVMEMVKTGKCTIIDLDDYDEEGAKAKKSEE